MLFITRSRDIQGELREFFFEQEHLEDGFAILEHIALRGHLLSVMVLDGESLIELPAGAFDERPSAPLVQALTQEWQRLLAPANLPQFSSWRSSLVCVRQQRHQQCMAKLEHAVAQVKHQIQQVEQGISREPTRSRTLNQLRSTLNRYERNLASEKAGLSRLARPLKKP